MTDDDRESALEEAYQRPTEDPVAKWKREADEQQRSFDLERWRRRREERRNAQPSEPAQPDWSAIDARIEAALGSFVRGAFKETMGDIAQFCEAVDQKLGQLELLLVKLQTISANERAERAGRHELLDLPSPLSPKPRVN
jgi:hypothetical protein